MFFKRKKKDEPITIVSGLPRSGTSMMMKILEAGGLEPLTDNLRTADDDNPRGYYEFERVKKLREGDLAWLPEARGKVVKVIATLLTSLPPGYTYRVVFMRRAMPEILASQKQMLVNRGEDADKISDEEMGRLFEQHLQRVNEWVKSQPNITRHDVEYSELVKDPQPHIEVVCEFLGEKLDIEKMVGVVDPKLYRQRREG